MDDEAKRELEATVAARKELGPAHDDELIAGFLARIDKEIERRVEQKLDRRGGGRRRHGLPLPVQLGPMIPIVIFAGVFGGTVGIVVALAAVVLIVLVNEFRR
ncbi:MAG TPA: hypothetical protein VFJ78_07605 [Gaiellaceae bacterium]|nr:hypothetical protein [Gaiellaceae bacterium]